MFELIAIVLIGMMLSGFISLAWKATWGVLKLLGILLSVIAFPILFVGILVIGVGAYLFLPVLLLAAAFGCIAKA